MDISFPGIGIGSLALVLVPAKEDLNPGKVQLRPLFFSSLISISFGKALESIIAIKALATENVQLRSTVAKQEAVNSEQRKRLEALTARLEEQDKKIQKVSAQLEVSKPAPQTVLNDQ